MKNTKLFIIILIIFLLLTLSLYLSSNCQNENYSQISLLKTVKNFKTDNMIKDYNSLSELNSTLLLNQTFINPTFFSNYSAMYNNYISFYNNLTTSNSLSLNGAVYNLTLNAFICPSNAPIAQLVDGKIYCTSDDISTSFNCIGEYKDVTGAQCDQRTGFMSQYYEVLYQALNGGSCNLLNTTQRRACPVDCVMSDWSDWSSCNLTCGGATQTRSRNIIYPSLNGGIGCDNVTSQSQSCNTQNCPVNCVLSGWSDWSACNVTCGGGTQTRSRNIVKTSQYGGTCSITQNTTGASEIENKQCNTTSCPVDCVMSDWSSWSPCSALCGGGNMTQSRRVINTALYGGTCPVQNTTGYVQTNTVLCNVASCPPPPRSTPTVSLWTSYGVNGISGNTARISINWTLPRGTPNDVSYFKIFVNSTEKFSSTCGRFDSGFIVDLRDLTPGQNSVYGVVYNIGGSLSSNTIYFTI